jgi:hypothetical protein
MDAPLSAYADEEAAAYAHLESGGETSVQHQLQQAKSVENSNWKVQ